MNNEPIRVVLADDHPAVRAGIRGALEKAADVVVVAEAADGEEAWFPATPSICLFALVRV